MNARLSARMAHAATAMAICAGMLWTGDPAQAQRPGTTGSSRDSISERDRYKELWSQGEYHEALQALEAQIAGVPALSQKLRYARSRLLFETGQIDEAIVDMKYLSDTRPQPWYTLELALMYRYRGHPTRYDMSLQRAASMMRDPSRRSWFYRNRNQNIAAGGRIHELMGTNPRTILSAHYGQMFDYFSDLGAEVHASAGDIAYRHAGYDTAERYYRQALEREPDYQPALAGLVECYWQSYDERLEDTLNVLLSLNPNHPRANAVVVERQLALGQTEPAREIIESQLAINPVSHRFRSLKATAQFLDDEEIEMWETINDTLDYNPVLSEIYRTVGRLASRHYRFQEGMELQEKALDIDPEDHEARALYTLDLMRLGREQEGREELEKAFDADPFNVHLFNLLQLMDTLETFRTVERGSFVLRLPEHEAPVMAAPSLDLLDRAITELEAKYRIDIEKPVLIEMFDNHDDFMVRSIGLMGNAGHLGICFGKLVTMDAPSVRPRGSSNWRAVLWHEFTHVITLQKTKNRMPRWLSEGISVYEETQYSPAWANRLDPDYMNVLAQEGIPDLGAIDAFFTGPKSPLHLMYGYFIAGEFVDFYVSTYTFDALVGALEAISEGVRAEAALVEAAETTLDELNETFNAYLLERLKPFDNLPAVAKEEAGMLERIAQKLTVVDEPDAEPTGDEERPSSPFTDALDDAEKAVAAQDWEAAEAALKKAHDLFPWYDGSDAPLRKLATLYEVRDRQQDFERTLEEIVAWTPTELDASHELIERYREAGRWEDVERVADWAIGIDPYDPHLHRAWLDSVVNLGREEEGLDTLAVLSHLDSGNQTDYRLRRAQILHGLGEQGPAKSEVIALLEEMPHYWRAQELLLSIVESDAGPEAADLEHLTLETVEEP